MNTAMGVYSRASGENSTAMGFSTDAIGTNSTAMGQYTEASGHRSTSMGRNTIASGSLSTAMGQYTHAGTSHSVALGRYNYNFNEGQVSSWNGPDPLFMIGNGTGPSDRHNAMVVLKDGRVMFPDSYWDEITGSFYRDLHISLSGMIGYLSSSSRYKSNVSSMEDIGWIYDLNPVNFNYNSDETETKQYGLIAEEVEEVNPSFVSYNEEGKPETVSYSQLISPMIKALQDQNKLIEELQARIEALEAE